MVPRAGSQATQPHNPIVLIDRFNVRCQLEFDRTTVASSLRPCSLAMWNCVSPGLLSC